MLSLDRLKRALLLVACLAGWSFGSVDLRWSPGSALRAQDGDAAESAQDRGNADDGDVDGDEGQNTEDEEAARERGRELFREQMGTDLLRNDEAILAAFSDVIADASESTVKIFSGRRQTSLGTVISADGFIVTKASELESDLSCQFADNRRLDAVLFGIDLENDVAILRVDADDLVPVTWSDGPAPPVGSWLVTAGQTPYPLAIGVVSVESRPIPPPRGVLGVFLGDAEPGATIDQVLPDSPAEKAGLKPGDVVIAADGEEVADRPSLQAIIGNKRPDQTVELTLRRANVEEPLVIRVTLGNRLIFDPENQRNLQQNQLGTRMSSVREGFELAVQHDSAIGSNECGGPVVGLEGRVVGINIARSGRVSSFALPVEVLLPILERLRSGEYGPAVVYRDRIDKFNADIDRIQSEIDNDLSPRLEQIEQDLAAFEEERQGLDQAADDGQDLSDEQTSRRTELVDLIADAEKSIAAARSSIRRAERRIRNLVRERDSLLGPG